jgi:hypothetical protein
MAMKVYSGMADNVLKNGCVYLPQESGARKIINKVAIEAVG